MLSTLQTHSGRRSLPQRACSSNRDMGEAKSFMQDREESAGSTDSTAARGSSSMLLFHWYEERNYCRKENLEHGKKKIKTHDVMSRSSKGTKLVHGELQICLKFNNALVWSAWCLFMVLLNRLFSFSYLFLFLGKNSCSQDRRHSPAPY